MSEFFKSDNVESLEKILNRLIGQTLHLRFIKGFDMNDQTIENFDFYINSDEISLHNIDSQDEQFFRLQIKYIKDIFVNNGIEENDSQILIKLKGNIELLIW